MQNATIRRMKAIVLDAPGGPGVMSLRELPEPEPGPGEVTIAVAYAGVGLVDTLFRRGEFALPMPLTPGIEVSGWVRATGAGVEHLAAGMPVAALLNDFVNVPGAGGYAEVARARAALTVPLPDGLRLADAAATLVNGATAWIAVNDVARLTHGEAVLIDGVAGGLGSTIARVARHAGAGRIVGIVGRPAAAASASALVDELIERTAAVSELERLFGHGIDVAFDMAGGGERRAVFDRLAPLGRMVIVGNASRADVQFPGDAFWHGSKSVHGLSLGGLAHRLPDRVGTAGRNVLALAARSGWSAASLVLPLAQAAQAHQLLEERTAPAKIVLAVAGDVAPANARAVP